MSFQTDSWAMSPKCAIDVCDSLAPPPDGSVEIAGDDDPGDALAPVAARAKPSSLRRVLRLRALIKEFSERDMDTAAVTLFLNCSSTSARQYLNDLLEASVICLRGPSPSEGRNPRREFHLNGDLWIARNFVNKLSGAKFGNALLKRDGKLRQESLSVGTRQFHIMADDCCNGVKATHFVVRRDPLVAALFGPRPKLVASDP